MKCPHGQPVETPVFVKGGEHLIQEIRSLDDALDFLDEWPRTRQGPIYEIGLTSVPPCL
jgi:hypothetical protein